MFIYLCQGVAQRRQKRAVADPFSVGEHGVEPATQLRHVRLDPVQKHHRLLRDAARLRPDSAVLLGDGDTVQPHAAGLRTHKQNILRDIDLAAEPRNVPKHPDQGIALKSIPTRAEALLSRPKLSLGVF